MPTAAEKNLPEPTLRRLPLYLHLLKQMDGTEADFVSCSLIGRELSLDPTQVRKDLEFVGVGGRPKVGYPLRALTTAIEQFLGWTSATEAFLVGAGNLGAALLGYGRLHHYGVTIVAAFDNNPAKIGTDLNGRTVFPLIKLPELARRMRIQVGIITVPAAAAQSVADLMVVGGIRAIWNFAPVRLRVPETVIVQEEELYYSLASLSRKLNHMLRQEALAAAPAETSEASATPVESVASAVASSREEEV